MDPDALSPLARQVAAELEVRVPPDRCETMGEVRAGVDALDRALVAIVAERQRYMGAAARIKPDREAVRDEARIDDVLRKVGSAAVEAGLDPMIAGPVWRMLVDRCIAYELGEFDRLRS
ncbi:MAG TPA: chorismate mutase [Caulobacteraceae bacterium]|jgi:isochorismate pyruvate lyase